MNNDRPPLKIIPERFFKHFAAQGIHLPEDHLRERRKGSLPYGSGRIFFIFGEENGREFLEYYAHHRIGGDAHRRIYEDGSEECLDELSSWYAYNPDIPGDRERKEAEMKKKYQETLDDLARKGMFDDEPVPGDMAVNSYLVLHGDEPDQEDRG
jgi:hypothetical protein